MRRLEAKQGPGPLMDPALSLDYELSATPAGVF